MTRSERGAADVSALLRARNPLLWVVTREEARVEGYLIEAAGAAGYVPRTWDVAQGVCDLSGRSMDLGDRDPGSMLAYIDGRGYGRERGVWIMRDLAPWVSGTVGLATCRQLRNLARKLPSLPRDSAQAIIVLSTSADVPADLSGHATVIDWPMPDRDEIAAILGSTIESLPEAMQSDVLVDGRDAAIDAALGLMGEEAAACFAKSLVQSRTIDSRMVAQEKRRVISRERVLEWFDPLPGGLDAVGGLDNLKAWLVARRAAYSPEARAFGLPAPRGALLVGVPGCGKSLTAKAIATAWGVPLLRLDLGGLKSKWVGESEGNLRRVFSVVGAIGRCVVWLDEIEKSLAGATQGAADGGVSSDALGAVLAWMQERQGEAFVVATANDVSSLPPELMRKGRFDEIWFVDLPTREERFGVLAASLVGYGRGKSFVDLYAVADKTEGFTGAEIAALVPDALYAAFADGGRDIVTDDLIAAASVVVPLSKTSAAKIEALRAWGVGRARMATKAEAETRRSTTRAVDL